MPKSTGKFRMPLKRQAKVRARTRRTQAVSYPVRTQGPVQRHLGLQRKGSTWVSGNAPTQLMCGSGKSLDSALVPAA